MAQLDRELEKRRGGPLSLHRRHAILTLSHSLTTITVQQYFLGIIRVLLLSHHLFCIILPLIDLAQPTSTSSRVGQAAKSLNSWLQKR